MARRRDDVAFPLPQIANSLNHPVAKCYYSSPYTSTTATPVVLFTPLKIAV